MNLELTPDQQELQAAVHRIAEPYASAPSSDTSYYLDGTPLYEQLQDAGFLEAAGMPEYGPLAGALILEITSALPYSIGVAGTALVLPMITGESFEGPVALMRAGRESAVRHLPHARTLLVVGDEDVSVYNVADIETRQLKSIFADPFGSVAPESLQGGRKLGNVSPADVIKWWNVAVAAEIAGASDAALKRTVEFVKIRRQFGRAIGSYQAIQHRLAECEVLVNATRMLARRAAVTGDAAAAFLAASYAQAAAGRVAYETQQFHGASGLTREIELHFFTYRLRSLQGELTALGGSPLRAAELLWPGATDAKSDSRVAVEKHLVA